MRRHIVAVLVISFGSLAIFTGLSAAPTTAPASRAAVAGELAVLKSFPIGTEGKWDYITIDPVGQRVYVPHGTRVVVLDAATGKVLGEVADTPGVHGVAVVPELNKGFATNGKDGTISVFDLKTLQTLQKIKAGKGPDAILYDPASKKIYAFNHGSGEVTLIDPAALDQEPITLDVGGALEFGVADGAGHVYVNVEDKHEVVAIDSKQQKIIAHWSVAPGEGPTGLAMDVKHRRLFSGCGNKMMVILDADSGKVLGTAPIGAGVDGVAFVPSVGLALSANGGDGTLTAVREEAGQFTVVQTLKTAKGARTIAAGPMGSSGYRIYLPCRVPAEEGGKAAFTILVVGPAEAK